MFLAGENISIKVLMLAYIMLGKKPNNRVKRRMTLLTPPS
jgi:hypothetical protein